MDVSLLTTDGSILDALTGDGANVVGNNIDLQANGGSVGDYQPAVPEDLLNQVMGDLDDTEVDELMIDTGLAGVFSAMSDSGIFIEEVSGSLKVSNVVANTGHIRLTVPDTAGQESDLLLTDDALIHAIAGSVILRIGDDLQVPEGAEISARVTIDIYGDWGDADAGTGTTIEINGAIDPVTTDIFGNGDDDTFILGPTEVVGHTRVWGFAGDDVFTVNQLPTMTSTLSGSRDTLDLHGAGGTDLYTVNVTGDADYIINVIDTGAPDDGNDELVINGTDNADSFLLRHDMVASLDGAYVEDTGYVENSTNVERINYDRNINARLTVNGELGDDYFATDENSSITTLDGGDGKDRFQIGQVFGTPRTIANGLAATDVFDTTEITIGYLSRGISFPTTILGGNDEDTFSIYSNKAPLELYGEAGNDTFTVRAFAKSSNTLIDTGSGDDLVQYNINAPVNIDGGTGVDTVVVIGTEFGDNFAITEDGIFRAGLSVGYYNIEVVEIDVMEGDDHFFVLGTKAGVLTTIIGGLGSDTFDVGGDVSSPIVAQSVEGGSGVINHAVVSDDPDYANNLFVPGLRLNIADAEIGVVNIQQKVGVTNVDDNETTVIEQTDIDEFFDPNRDSYTISMSVAAPTVATVAYINVSVSQPGFKDRSRGGKSILISETGAADSWQSSLVLSFDSVINWNDERTIFVKAEDDDRAEGVQKAIISHSMISTNTEFDTLSSDQDIANVKVAVIDNELSDVILRHTGGDTVVTEGGSTDTVGVRLSSPPDTGVFGIFTEIFVTPQPTVDIFFSDPVLRFTSLNSADEQFLTIHAQDDSLLENAEVIRFNALVTTALLGTVIDVGEVGGSFGYNGH
jgi:hypothetical protein